MTCNVSPELFFGHLVVPCIVGARIPVVDRACAKEDKCTFEIASSGSSRIGQRLSVVLVIFPAIVRFIVPWQYLSQRLRGLIEIESILDAAWLYRRCFEPEVAPSCVVSKRLEGELRRLQNLHHFLTNMKGDHPAFCGGGHSCNCVPTACWIEHMI